MPAKRARRNNAEPPVGTIVTEKHVDTTDEEQSSDDEAPEEVSAAAATALAGRRRKAEQQARQAAPAPKRNKRARSSSSKGGKNASTSADVAAVAEGGGEGLVGGGGEIELPSDLLLKVKSGGLQRMEADVLAAREMKKQAEAASATALSAGRKVKKRAGDLPRSDNFQLVVLDEDGGGNEGAGSKPVAAENARKFLRDRLGSRKRVSYSLLKARQRLGPSPSF